MGTKERYRKEREDREVYKREEEKEGEEKRNVRDLRCKKGNISDD